MTLQTYGRPDGRTGGGGRYHNIPAFSSKSAGIKINFVLYSFEQVTNDTKHAYNGVDFQ